MRPDEVLAEIWRIKDKRAERYHFSARELGAALMRAQQKGGRPLIQPPPVSNGGKRRTG